MFPKSKVLIVGAFPPKGSSVYGGVLATCSILLRSEFRQHYNLILIDSTQRKNPPETFIVRGMLAFLRLFKFMKNLICYKPDLILLFTSTGSSLVEKGTMGWLGKLRKIPVLMFPRAGGIVTIAEESHFQRIWMTLALKSATQILCQGPLIQRFGHNIIGYPLERLPIIENWTATDDLLKIGECRSKNMQGESQIFLFLGWLEENKGIFELLEAVRFLSQTNSFRLVIAGSGSCAARAHSYVEANQLTNIVKFVGWVNHEEKKTLLAEADILVLPSWSEGFPNAIIEAMAAKVAVIVSAVGNIPDLISSYDQAILVPPKNIDALKFAMQELLMDSATRAAIAERGYRFAIERFSSRQGLSKLIYIIDSEINTGDRRRWLPNAYK